MSAMPRPRMERKKALQDYIVNKHLKSTKQREIIFNEFFDNDPGKHVTVEELYENIKKRHPKIGFATVYRTLKLFKESGIASERNFGDGKARYEPIRVEEEHHHHIICTKCGDVVEFANDKIEACLTQIAKLNGYDVLKHKLEVYGYCSACKENP